jgi:hypothetical protein
MPRSRGVDRVLLTVALAAHGLVWLFATRPVALDPDPMNLAYGMYRFDITHSNPHAPGYLIYVWTLKAVHRLTGGGAALLERFATVQLVALLFALAAIFTVYAAARRLKLATGAAGWAALVIALHPILVFHSVDAQTHTSEAFASALLLWGAIFYRERPGWRRALWLGLFLAFGSALRPSFVIFGVPVIVWTIGFRRFAYLAVAGLASVVGAIGWIAPTVYASGGWEIWRTATRRLVHGRFVLTSSPFSDTAVASLVSANQMSLALWTLETILPLLVAWAVVAAGRRDDQAPLSKTSDGRWLAGVLAAGGSCAILYYAATFVSEPGYLAALLPPVALYVGAQTGGAMGARPAAYALVTLLLCWAIPVLPNILKVPSVAEWRRRTALPSAYVEHVESALPQAGRYLVITSHPEITLGRQLSMLSPRVDALLVHDGRYPWFARTSLTYVTQDDTTPIPDAYGPPGTGASTATSREYAGLYFDGSLAPHFQAQIAQRSTCPVARAADVTETVVLPARCLKDATVALDELELRLGVAGAPAR